MITLDNAIDIQGIEQTFVQLVSTVTGSTTIIAEQSDAPYPQVEQLATVHFLAVQTVGQPDISYSTNGDDLTETITDDERGTVSINIFRETQRNSIQAAEIIKTYLRSSQATQTLSSAGIGFIRTSETRNLSEVEKTRWEGRAQFDVEIYALNTISVDQTAIDTITISGEVDDNGTLYPVDVEYDQ